MALTLEQRPKYLMLPIGDNVIFSVMDEALFTPAVKTRVKYIARVYVSVRRAWVQTTNSKALVATLKTTPNASGRGIFDLRPILESYVSPDYTPHNPLSPVVGSTTSYKGIPFSDNNRFPIHLIDKYTMGADSSRYFTVKFGVEFLNSSSNQVEEQDGNDILTHVFYFFNGYVKNTNILTQSPVGTASVCYGLDLNIIQDASLESTIKKDIIQGSGTAHFISNAPTTQYAKLKDYGTFAMFNQLTSADYGFGTGALGLNQMGYIQIKLYNAAGIQQGSDIDINNNATTGGFPTPNEWSQTHFLYYGIFPGNLTGAFTVGDWVTYKDSISYYTVRAFSATDDAITRLYTINILCTPSSKGYTSVRLTWLNQYGTWDYYTFLQKSVRRYSTNKTTYTQLGGTWNENQYKPDGWNGGKKPFRVNNKESMVINTDFINEEEARWFEELINSPEVYILNKYQGDTYESSFTISGFTNKYVEAVLLKTSSYTRKTVANDKLIQYTFEVERNIDQRTQSI